MAPPMVKLLIASTTMITNRAIIMTFVTRSRPFCRPREQTKKPMTTATAIKPTIETGSAQMLPKAWLTSSEESPENFPEAVETK